MRSSSRMAWASSLASASASMGMVDRATCALSCIVLELFIFTSKGDDITVSSPQNHRQHTEITYYHPHHRFGRHPPTIRGVARESSARDRESLTYSVSFKRVMKVIVHSLQQVEGDERGDAGVMRGDVHSFQLVSD